MKNMENQEKFEAGRKARYRQEDVNGRLVFSLLDIGHTMRSLYEGRGSQRRILIVLSETGAITQRELTERLGIQPGSASEVIAKLENAGLVTRTPSKTDRRTADISLTEEGVRQAEEARKQRVQRHVEMFSALTEEEKARLLALLEKVNSDWESRYADRRECHEGHRHGRHHHEHEHGERHDGSGGRQGCNHNCASCTHPCGQALREEGR